MSLSGPEFTSEEKQLIVDNFEALARDCPQCQDPESQDMIRRAFNMANEAHYPMRRESYEPFIHHPIEVARIAGVEIGLDAVTVACALLHDVVEDCKGYNYKSISNHFDDQFATIVKGLTKITNVYDDQENLQAATFRKMLLSIQKDVRVIYIKISDRLHNMRTMESMPEHKQKIKAGETLYVYAPLAHLLGLYKIKIELEDLSFKYRYAKDYISLVSQIVKYQAIHDDIIDRKKLFIEREFKKAGIEYRIETRSKSLLAAWNLLVKEAKGKTFGDLDNSLIIRIIINAKTEENERELCYRAFSRITDSYALHKNSFSDVIKNPLLNGFMALKFSVLGRNGKLVAFEILTERMHKIAQFGQDIESNGAGISQLEWAKTIEEILNDPKEDLISRIDEVTKWMNVDYIYAFTPKGDMYVLPVNSSVIDFAFTVHSELGLKCIGAKVNGVLKQPFFKLRNSDRVEILSNGEIKVEEDWLNYVKTLTAKKIIKKYLAKQKIGFINIGTELLRNEFRKLNIRITNKRLDQLTKIFDCSNHSEFCIKIAREMIDTEKLTEVLTAYAENGKIELSDFIRKKDSFNLKNTQYIDDSNANLFIYSNCCHPIPGDSALILNHTDGKPIVHRADCKHALKIHSSKGKAVKSVRWSDHLTKLFVARIRISGIDSEGLLKKMMETIYSDKFSYMKAVNLKVDGKSFAGYFDLDVKKDADLDNILRKMNNLNEVEVALRDDDF